MVLPISEVRRIVERVCARQDVFDACAKRDLGYVIGVLNASGLTQEQIASLTGLHQNRLSNYKTGKHEPKEISVFAAFADGLGLPPAARQALGLDVTASAPAGLTVPQPRPASAAEISLEYPATPAQAAGNVTSLWQADLADEGILQRGRIDPAAWKDASFRWLVEPAGPPEAERPGGIRVGIGDVERFNATVEMFAQLDDRFGGGHARQPLIQYLSGDGNRLLRGRYSQTVGTALFSSVAEATLLAAWMSYDSAPGAANASCHAARRSGAAPAGSGPIGSAGSP